MKLLTKALTKRFLEVGSQEEIYNPLVIAKFFNPSGAGTWLATEYSPEDQVFFGYVSIFGDQNDEWGYFSLKELASYSGAFGLGIERDRLFKETRIIDVMPKALIGEPCCFPVCPRMAEDGVFCAEHTGAEGIK